MQAAPRPSGSACALSQPVVVEPDDLAGAHVAIDARRRSGRARRSRTRRPSRRRCRPSVERADPVRVAERDERARRRARRPSTHPRGGASSRPTASGSGAGIAGDQRRDHLGVGGRAEPDAVGDELVAQTRRHSSGCRCGRARRCARGRGGRAAARSTSARRRSSSSACARSRPRREAPAAAAR